MEEKLCQALEIIDRDGFATVKDLTRALGVARGTTDRYLQRLEERRLIKRVQGGAISLHREFEFCPDFYYSVSDPYFQERTRIACKAVELISGSDCVFIGGGRDTLHVAKALKLRGKSIPIITNSLHVAMLLSGVCQVSVAGITPTSDEGILTGAVGDDMCANKAIIAPGSITDDGFYNATPAIVQLETAFVRKARETIILADSEVYSTYKPYKMFAYSDVSTIVTTKKAPSFIRKGNVTVCTV